MQNLLQPMITTMPMTGVRPFLRGVSETISKLQRYFALRFEGVSHEAAFREVFKEFTERGLGAAPISEAVLRDALEETVATTQGMAAPVLGGDKRKAWQAFKDIAMRMFSATETWNRLVSFEAGKAKAIMDGLRGEKALEFASNVVRATQFPAGIGQMPRILLSIPAPWRQFMYFPIRYAGFLAESLRWGGGLRRNWGTIARSILASAVVARMARDILNVDLTRGLMFGALPVPQFEGTPFYPFPVVPPIIGLAGSVVHAVATGDTQHLRYTLPLLAPGGIFFRRAYETLSPKYADYRNRDAQGRIPVYNREGMLIGYQTPLQLFMRAVGFPTISTRAEQELTQYLLKQRDRIRDFRRRYVNAIMQNKPVEASRIQEEFRRAYPSLGKLQIKKSDLTAYERRMLMARLIRILRTLPKEYRQEFADYINIILAHQFGEEISPLNLVQPVEGGEPIYSYSPQVRIGTPQITQQVRWQNVWNIGQQSAIAPPFAP